MSIFRLKSSITRQVRSHGQFQQHVLAKPVVPERVHNIRPVLAFHHENEFKHLSAEVSLNCSGKRA